MNNIVGNIYQKEGYCHKEFTTIDTYHLTFPNDANINDKLNLIGAVVLMNYTYYIKGNCSGDCRFDLGECISLACAKILGG